MENPGRRHGRETPWHPPQPPSDENSPAARDAFAAPDFNDSNWDDQPVPSNWEMAGYSLPTYDDVDDTVGLYRRAVTVPAAWAGKRVYWHFDGALDGAEVFVNGQKAGYHESGYTAFDVDLTGLVKPGESNLFAVRVSKTTPSFDCDTGDFQSMGGIYRDTSLIAVPETRVDDLTVRTPLAANHHDATLNVQVHVAGKPGQSVAVTGQLFSADGRPAGVSVSGSGQLQADGTAQIAMSTPVQAPALWSAEKPNLYYLVFSLTSGGETIERVEQRFGFRQIEIKDNVVLWNGTPIKCTGVCRHDFWYGPDHLRQENNKGIVDAYRHPKAEWWIVKSVYSPVVVEARTVNPAGESCTVPLTNHYSFTDLSELTCRWTAFKGDATLQTGTRQVACAPMQSVRAEFPAPAGTTALRLDFQRRDGTSVIAFNLAAEGVPIPSAPPALASGGALTSQDNPDTLIVKNARQQWTFDKHDGTIRSWRVAGRDVLTGDPALNLGESRGKNKGGDDKGIYRADAGAGSAHGLEQLEPLPRHGHPART